MIIAIFIESYFRLFLKIKIKKCDFHCRHSEKFKIMPYKFDAFRKNISDYCVNKIWIVTSALKISPTSGSQTVLSWAHVVILGADDVSPLKFLPGHIQVKENRGENEVRAPREYLLLLLLLLSLLWLWTVGAGTESFNVCLSCRDA